MVFVTVGSTRNDFSRLIEEVDALAAAGIIEDVQVQVGFSRYVPRSCAYERFLRKSVMLERIREADFVIAHAGTGTVNACLEHRKKTIVMPRRAEFGEHPDDHQLELGDYLALRNRVMLVLSPGDLGAAVRSIGSWSPTFRESDDASSMHGAIERFLESTFSGTMFSDAVGRQRPR